MCEWGRRSGRRGKDGVPDVFRQRWEYGIVVLEERAPVVLEDPVAYLFAHQFFVIGDADVFVEFFGQTVDRIVYGGVERVSEEEGYALFVGVDVSEERISALQVG